MIKVAFYGDINSQEYETFLIHYWEMVREKRDELIKDTYFTQMSDAPFTDETKRAFAAYRKALRDLPQNFSNPNDVVWPEKPAL